MGCDVFYDGHLFNPILQEKVVELVSSFYANNYYIVRPEPETYYHTWCLREKPSEQYPFNYYGVVPQLSDDSLLNRGQFVFDRTAGGKLVTLHKFPSPYKMAWSSSYEDAVSDVVVENGGYDRMLGSVTSFVFLLTLIKIKWWSEFNFGDDYCCDEEIMDKLCEIDLDVVLKKKYMDFDSAWDLYLKATGRNRKKQKHDNKGDQSLFPEENQKKEENNPEPDLRLVYPNPEEVSLEDMDLCIRSTRCLERSGVQNLDQLLRYSKKDLIAIRNLGLKSVEEIMRTVRSYGYELHAGE